MTPISTDLPHIDNYSLWLIFDQESTTQCYSIIKRLAKSFQSVSFTPHITLSGTPDWNEDRIKQTVDQAIQGCSALELRTKTVRCSSNPYQKITHGIEISDDLSALHQKMDDCFKGDFAKRAYPHISYLYSKLSCEKVTSEIELFQKIAPKKIIAEQLALVRCKGTPEDWRTLYRWTFED